MLPSAGTDGVAVQRGAAVEQGGDLGGREPLRDGQAVLHRLAGAQDLEHLLQAGVRGEVELAALSGAGPRVASAARRRATGLPTTPSRASSSATSLQPAARHQDDLGPGSGPGPP